MDEVDKARVELVDAANDPASILNFLIEIYHARYQVNREYEQASI